MSIKVTLSIDISQFEKLRAVLEDHPEWGKLILPSPELTVHASRDSSTEACNAADRWLESRGVVEFQPVGGADEARHGAGYWSDPRGASALAVYCFFRADPQITARVCGIADHPHDASDFGRCLELLDAVPEWSNRVNELAEISPTWAKITASWSVIESAYRAGDMAEATKQLASSLENL